jgi:hypothetical protein
MKKALFILTVCFGSYSYAQNTLPATGKVGIGTTTPDAELEVKGETTVETFTAKDTSVFEKPVTIKDSVNIESKMTVEQDVKIKGQTVFVDEAKAKSDIKVLGTTKMKGDAFVEGDFKFKGLEDQNTTEERFLMIKPNGKAVIMEKAGINGLIYGPPASCTIDINGNYPTPNWTMNGGASPKAYIGAGCPISVGIGTNSPQTRLDVRGDTYNSGSVGIGVLPVGQIQLAVTPNDPNEIGICVDMTTSNDYNYGLKVKVDNDNLKGVALTNDASGEDVFRVYGNGTVEAEKVQIGELSSLNNTLNAELFVDGTTQLNGPIRFTGAPSDIYWNTWDAQMITPMGSAWVTSEADPDGNHKSFGITNSGWFFGVSPENIGSTNVDIKYAAYLTSNGKWVAREVEVTLDGWSDFVFEDDYELMTLEEVETFINENGHLPNVPSEAEVLENGVNLGDMDSILLRKIEELTLYIIELEKKVESLENQ